MNILNKQKIKIYDLIQSYHHVKWGIVNELICLVRMFLILSILQISAHSSPITVEKTDFFKQGPSGTNHGLEVNLEDKNQVRHGIRPSP